MPSWFRRRTRCLNYPRHVISTRRMCGSFSQVFALSAHFKCQNARLFSLPTSRTESMVFNRKKIDRQVKSSGCRLMKGQPISVDLSATWRRFTRCRCRFGNSNVFFAHSSQNVALLPTQRPVIWSSGTSSKYLCHPPGGARSNLDVAKYSPISLFVEPFTFVSKLANFPLRKVFTFDTVVKFKIWKIWIFSRVNL